MACPPEIEAFSRNIEVLRRRGFNHGYLRQLAEMGPLPSPHVDALTTATAAQLRRVARGER